MLIDMTLGRFQNKVFKLFLIGDQVISVGIKKNVGSEGADAFVSVDEGMVHHEMKKISSGHLENIRVEKDAGKGRRGRGDGRIQKACVTYSMAPTETFNLFSMEKKDFLRREETRFHFSPYPARFL